MPYQCLCSFPPSSPVKCSSVLPTVFLLPKVVWWNKYIYWLPHWRTPFASYLGAQDALWWHYVSMVTFWHQTCLVRFETLWLRAERELWSTPTPASTTHFLTLESTLYFVVWCRCVYIAGMLNSCASLPDSKGNLVCQNESPVAKTYCQYWKSLELHWAIQAYSMWSFFWYVFSLVKTSCKKIFIFIFIFWNPLWISQFKNF